MDYSLRDLQLNLPWTVKYHRDFRSCSMGHKDFAHAITHTMKALGKLSDLVNEAEHGGCEFTPEQTDRYVADLVVCALRMANTIPGRTMDLQKAVVDRIETKNGVTIKTDTVKKLEKTLRGLSNTEDWSTPEAVIRAADPLPEKRKPSKTPKGLFLITDTDIARLREWESKATPGPWHPWLKPAPGSAQLIEFPKRISAEEIRTNHGSDAIFIANMRTWFHKLVDGYEELKHYYEENEPGRTRKKPASSVEDEIGYAG